jgi:endonuclease/exonuclease/phosphatase family metal-dependent hydrolase
VFGIKWNRVLLDVMGRPKLPAEAPAPQEGIDAASRSAAARRNHAAAQALKDTTETNAIAVPRTFRILTYNIAQLRGVDGRRPERIARVIELAKVDVAALQELDVAGRFGIDQPHWLADRLEMSCQFVAARPSAEGAYGNALLSRLPLSLVQHGPLPCLPGREARAAQWARVELGEHRVEIINTHLGLARGERLGQAECLTGPAGAAAERACTPCCAVTSMRCLGLGCSACSRQLRDAVRVARTHERDHPSRFPLFRLDYVLASRG